MCLSCRPCPAAGLVDLCGPLAGLSYASGAIVVLALGGFDGLDVGVDRARDDQVSPACLVLVDDRCTLTVVAMNAHELR